jgi:hypothetical protein
MAATVAFTVMRPKQFYQNLPGMVLFWVEEQEGHQLLSSPRWKGGSTPPLTSKLQFAKCLDVKRPHLTIPLLILEMPFDVHQPNHQFAKTVQGTMHP